MKTIPMSFNQRMAKALLDNRKSVTRRPLKQQPNDFDTYDGIALLYDNNDNECVIGQKPFIPPCNIGDLVWVREPHRVTWTGGTLGEPFIEPPVWFEAGGNPEDEDCYFPDEKEPKKLWREASRMTLEITGIRIEQLMGITEAQANAEGFKDALPIAKAAFLKEWDSIYNNSYENPFVWVIEFEVIHQNIDSYIAQQEAI